MATTSFSDYYSKWWTHNKNAILHEPPSYLTWGVIYRAALVNTFGDESVNHKTKSVYISQSNAEQIKGNVNLEMPGFNDVIGGRCLNFLAWPHFACNFSKLFIKKTIDTIDRSVNAPGYPAHAQRDSSGLAKVLKTITLFPLTLLEAVTYPLARLGDVVSDTAKNADKTLTNGAVASVVNGATKYVIAPILGLATLVVGAGLAIGMGVVAGVLIGGWKLLRMAGGAIESMFSGGSKDKYKTTASINDKLGIRPRFDSDVEMESRSPSASNSEDNKHKYKKIFVATKTATNDAGSDLDSPVSPQIEQVRSRKMGPR